MSGFGPSVSNRILTIVDTYYSERFFEKYHSLEKSLVTFIDALGLSKDYTFHMDSEKLISLTKSYFFDVVKYKEYHFNPTSKRKLNPLGETFTQKVHQKKISLNKAGAFTAKWIINHSPIIITIDPQYDLSQKENDLLLSVNAMFALVEAASVMNISVDEITIKLREEILYHFMYRNFDERHFFMIFGELIGEYNID